MEFNKVVNAKNLDEAWEFWFNCISSMNEQKESRDGDVVGEVVNAITVIKDPTQNIMKNSIRNLPMRYAIGEALWYLSGNNKLDEIRKYAKTAWDRMSDDGETVNSNYGWCIKHKFGFDQWEYVLEKLKKNPEDRQAVIHIKTADNKPSKDVNCTVALQFFVREGKLYMTTYMRSNDLWNGFPYDVFQFTCMQVLMSMQLGVGIGTYTHIAGSLHMYKRDFDKIEINKTESSLVETESNLDQKESKQDFSKEFKYNHSIEEYDGHSMIEKRIFFIQLNFDDNQEYCYFSPMNEISILSAIAFHKDDGYKFEIKSNKPIKFRYFPNCENYVTNTIIEFSLLEKIKSHGIGIRKSYRYAHYADYLRFYYLYHEGGIYMDTDIVVRKNLSNLLNNDFVVSTELHTKINDGFMMATPKLQIIANILHEYENNYKSQSWTYNSMTVLRLAIKEYCSIPNQEKKIKVLNYEEGFHCPQWTEIENLLLPVDNPIIVRYMNSCYSHHIIGATCKSGRNLRDYIGSLVLGEKEYDLNIYIDFFTKEVTDFYAKL